MHAHACTTCGSNQQQILLFGVRVRRRRLPLRLLAAFVLLAGSGACLHSQALTVVKANAPAPSASGTLGSLQRVFNPNNGDFFYVSGSNMLNAVNTAFECSGCERVIASIPVGAASAGATSALTLALDTTRKLLYAFNSNDGALYVIDVSHGSTTSMTVVGSLSAAMIDNPGTTLIGVDTGINVVYLAGPTTIYLTEVCGGTSPALIQGQGGILAGAGGVSALSVDSAHNIAYFVGQYSGSITNPPYISLVKPAETLVCNPTNPTVISAEKTLLEPTTYGFSYSTGDGQATSLDLESNSIAADSSATSLLAVGVPALKTQSAAYDFYDDFQFSGFAPLVDTTSLDWLPVTVTLDSKNQFAYITDFNGNLSGGASHAAMIAGLGSVDSATSPLTDTEIPVFKEAPPTKPQVYDAQADPTTKSAWISASDETDGGFVAVWDSQNSVVARTTIDAAVAAGGHLVLNGQNQGILLDEVNHQLYLLNTPSWTTVGTPTITPPTTSDPSVTIAAEKAGDDVYYTVNTGAPLISSAPATKCTASPCTKSVTPGQYYRISAVEEDTAGNAGNVVTELVAAQAPLSSFKVVVTPIPATVGKLSATATLVPNTASVTGTVTFTLALGSSPSTTICNKVAGSAVTGGVHFTCNFAADLSGNYTIKAAFSGDPLNEADTASLSFTVNASTTTPLLGNIPAPSSTIYPVALNSNDSGTDINVVLYSDSSLGVVQNGQLTAQKCAAFPGLPAPSSTLGVQQAALFFDGASNTVYLAMIYVTKDSGGNYAAELIAAYETLGASSCTQGPEWVLNSSTTQLPSNLEINVDLTLGAKYPSLRKGQMYVLNYAGNSSATNDQLLMLPIPWTSADVSSKKSLTATLDKNVYYGPIVLDTSNHRVYIDDLGFDRGLVPGSFKTTGFFVYDPIVNGSLQPVFPKNLELVSGYVNSNLSKVAFNAGTLLTDNAGKLVLVEENPGATFSGSSGYPILSVPILHFNTTSPLFFKNTVGGPSIGSVYITPGAALVSIKAGCQSQTVNPCPYNGIAGADINPATETVYGFGYAGNVYATNPGSLVSWSLSNNTETIVAKGLPMLQDYTTTGPWPQLNYLKYNSQLALSDPGNALGISTPVCEGGPKLKISQLVGTYNGQTDISAPSLNQPTGFVYAVMGQSTTYPPLPRGVNFIEPLAYPTPAPTGCPALPAQAEHTFTTAANQSATYSPSAQTVTLSATVASAGGGPIDTGTVTFTLLNASGATVGTAVTSPTVASGDAKVTYTLPAGTAAATYTIKAVYNPGSGFQTSSDTLHTLIVDPATMPAPVFKPGAGTYTTKQTVQISDTVSTATIYYTINGATPTTSSTKYTAAITVAASETLEAIAVAPNYKNSAVTTAKYVITP